MKAIGLASVDSGIICITDWENLKNEAGNAYQNRMDDRNIDVEIFEDIDPGLYNVYVCIPETWNGDVESFGSLRVTSGKLIVTDPCYWFDNERDGNGNWNKFLDKFGMCIDTKSNEDFQFISSMGGDGNYHFFISLEKIEE